MLKGIPIVEQARRMPPPIVELEPVVYIRSWQLSFVQDCNMRCTYCISGYGRQGGQPGVMNRDAQQQLLDMAFKEEFHGRGVEFDFGNGETLFYFDEFMQFLERAEQAALRFGMDLSVHVATNGILLDDDKMNILADHQIALTFSIDGPAHIHDRYRLDSNGNPTHERAMRNWRRYHEITAARPEKIGCSVTSVLGDGTSLLDVNDFWLSQGLETYECSITEPSDFLGEYDYLAWQARRTKYLEDLEFLAMEQARKLNVPGFLSDFAGPVVIKSAWINLLAGRNAGACGVGKSLVGVDMYGNIYPCDSFSGNAEWAIGRLDVGFYRPTLAQFRGRVAQLRTTCNSCEAEQLCDGGCVATRVGNALKLNKQGGCTFNKEVADISQRSFQVMLENS